MRTRAHVVLPLALILTLAAVPTEAGLNAYLELTDEPGGTPIVGGVDEAGREGQVEVDEFHHLMEVAGGTTTVDHQTVIVTVKLNDPSLPTLLQKMDTNGLVGVTVHFWEPNMTGQEINFMDMTLTDAKVVSFEPLLPNNEVAELLPLAPTARIRFSYATITVNNLLAASSHTLTNSGN